MGKIGNLANLYPDPGTTMSSKGMVFRGPHTARRPLNVDSTVLYICI